MTDDDFLSFTGSYENFVTRGLGDEYRQKATHAFKSLVLAERSPTYSNASNAKLLPSAKKLLIRAFIRLGKSGQFKSYKPYFDGWSSEVDQAESASDIGQILRRASRDLFPEREGDPFS